MTKQPIEFQPIAENDEWFGLEPDHCRDFAIDLNVYHDGDAVWLNVYHRYDDDPDFTSEPFLTLKIPNKQEGN